MSEEFKKYKEEFLKNFSYKEEEITEEEYNENSKLERYYNYYTRYEDNIVKYYKKSQVDLTNDEMNLFIQMRQYELNEEMDSKLGSIKGILLFWLIIGVLGFLLSYGMLFR